MKPLVSWITSYYRGWERLKVILGVWASYPPSIRLQMELVIVDDGSPPPDSLDDPEKISFLEDFCKKNTINLRVFFILEDLGFNSHAARNIGGYVAYGSILAMTDMDVTCEKSDIEMTFEKMKTCQKGNIVYFKRLGSSKKNPNQFFLRKDDFWKMGAYNEDLNGCYGTDFEFRGRVKRFLHRVDSTKATITWSPDGEVKSLERVRKRLPSYRFFPQNHLRLGWKGVWSSPSNAFLTAKTLVLKKEDLHENAIWISKTLTLHDLHHPSSFYLPPILNTGRIFKIHLKDIFPSLVTEEIKCIQDEESEKDKEPQPVIPKKKTQKQKIRNLLKMMSKTQ